MASKKSKYTGISIPTPLFKKIKERIKGTGFKSVSEYVTFVLREIVSYKKESKEKPFSEKEKRKVIKKLKNLGYL